MTADFYFQKNRPLHFKLTVFLSQYSHFGQHALPELKKNIFKLQKEKHNETKKSLEVLINYLKLPTSPIASTEIFSVFLNRLANYLPETFTEDHSNNLYNKTKEAFTLYKKTWKKLYFALNNFVFQDSIQCTEENIIPILDKLTILYKNEQLAFKSLYPLINSF